MYNTSEKCDGHIKENNEKKFNDCNVFVIILSKNEFNFFISYLNRKIYRKKEY